MSSLFKRAYVTFREVAVAIDTAHAVRHGGPVSDHARVYRAPASRA